MTAGKELKEQSESYVALYYMAIFTFVVVLSEAGEAVAFCFVVVLLSFVLLVLLLGLQRLWLMLLLLLVLLLLLLFPHRS